MLTIIKIISDTHLRVVLSMTLRCRGCEMLSNWWNEAVITKHSVRLPPTNIEFPTRNQAHFRNQVISAAAQQW